MHDINTLKTSTDFNYQKKQDMTDQLKKLAVEASVVIDGEAKGNFSYEEKRYLGMVRSHAQSLLSRTMSLSSKTTNWR